MIEKSLGDVVRRLRESKQISLRSLAETTGFSAAFMSQVENGHASPSISSMEKIAAALGVTLGQFFGAAETRASSVVPSSRRSGLNSGWSKARLESLSADAGGRLEAVLVMLEPGGTSGKHAYPPPTEEFVFVLSGEVELLLGEREHTLTAGDAVTIFPETPRRWSNPADKPVEILVISARKP